MGFLTGSINETPDIVKDVTIADSFVVSVRWLSPKQRDEIAKQCTEYKRGMPDINRERHARAYTKRGIVGWKGLTLDVLTGPLKISLHPAGLESLKKVQAENHGELPYNADDATLLYLNALPERFANKIKEVMDDIDDDASKVEALAEKK